MDKTAILSGLLAMFFNYIADVEQPEVTWFNPKAINGKTMLGNTECGYHTNTVTGEKTPFCKIHLNECLIGNPSELIDTYLHELAHHVDWVSDEDWDNHSGQWRRLTRKWDLVSDAARANGKVRGCDYLINH